MQQNERQMSQMQDAAKVEEAISVILERFEIGKEIFRRCGKTSPRGLIATLAEEHGVNRDTAQKLRAMADPDTGYTKAEINRLCRDFRKTGYSLTVSHFVKLVSVPKGRKRDRLTAKAIENRWSTHELQAEILAVQGRRQVGGRRPKVVTGKAFEKELSNTLWSWNRWIELHLDEHDAMRSDVAKQLRSLQRKFTGLQKVLDES